MARPDIKSAKWAGPARSFTTGRIRPSLPNVIVIHTTEGGETSSSAEGEASFAKTRTDGTSAHLYIDPDSTLQCVEFKDEAHSARQRGNDIGIQIEMCGKTSQTAANWADGVSSAEIARLIQACVEIRAVYGRSRFPLVHLTSAQVAAGKSGFAGHKDITFAFPADGGDHTDPGPGFPWSALFAGISAREFQLDEKEHDMTLDEVLNIAWGRGESRFTLEDAVTAYPGMKAQIASDAAKLADLTARLAELEAPIPPTAG